MKNRSILALLVTVPLATFAQTVRLDSTMTSLKVGYFATSIDMLSGAVDKVTQDRMNKGMVISSLDALSGQAAGVQVATGGNQEAMVSAVRVRGTTSLTGGNDPLVIIDGVAADLAILSTVYPAEIESFTILKDASETAQYGSRGASGVIEVATKKGRNQPFHISYDGSISVESVYKRLQMLNADQFRQANTALGLPYIDKGANTDFNKSIERTGFVHNNHIAFGGGSETANYRASVGVMEHRTIIRTNNYRNYIAKLDISHKAFDNMLAVDLGMFGSLQKNNYLPFMQKLICSAATFNPTFPDGANADGSYDQVPEALWITNPNALLTMKQDEDNAHFNVHLNATLILSPNLKLRAFGSYSYNSVNNSHYYPTIVWSQGEAYRGNDKNVEMLGNVSVNYTINTRNTSLNIMALAEAQNKKSTGFFTTVTNFSTDAFGYDELTAGASRPWDGTDSEYADSHMESFLLRRSTDTPSPPTPVPTPHRRSARTTAGASSPLSAVPG